MADLAARVPGLRDGDRILFETGGGDPGRGIFAQGGRLAVEFLVALRLTAPRRRRLRPYFRS